MELPVLVKICDRFVKAKTGHSVCMVSKAKGESSSTVCDETRRWKTTQEAISGKDGRRDASAWLNSNRVSNR